MEARIFKEEKNRDNKLLSSNEVLLVNNQEQHMDGFKTLTQCLLGAFISIKSLDSEILLVLPFSVEFPIKNLGCSLDAIFFFYQDYHIETPHEVEIQRQ